MHTHGGQVHSDKLQGLINGKPVMVINGGSIDVQALKTLNMHVNDLLQAMRAAEYFSLEEIIYGIMETNGQLTVVCNKNMEDKQQTLPVPVILEGKWNEENINGNGFDKDELQRLLVTEHVKVKNVVLLAIDENNRMTLQRRNAPICFKDVEVTRK